MNQFPELNKTMYQQNEIDNSLNGIYQTVEALKFQLRTIKIGSIVYFRNGKINRDDGPAIIMKEYTRKKIKNKKTFIVYEIYVQNGIIHRDDGAAAYSYNKDGVMSSYHYYQNGVLHRLDGPARNYIDGYDNSWAHHYYIKGYETSSKNYHANLDVQKCLNQKKKKAYLIESLRNL